MFNLLNYKGSLALSISQGPSDTPIKGLNASVLSDLFKQKNTEHHEDLPICTAFPRIVTVLESSIQALNSPPV